jgi:hypothetical protein
MGLMLIPRVLSRCSSPSAQKEHFRQLLIAGGELSAVIYNSPVYGFETKAELFFQLQEEFPALVGFEEFGGAKALSYAAEFITSGGGGLTLMAGVDTQVYHDFVNCGATGAITGVGNALPKEVLRCMVMGDIAWRGNWFFLIEGHCPEVRRAMIEELTAFTWAVRQALYAAAITGRDCEEIDHVEVFADPEEGVTADSQNFVLCLGKAYDRSPCGTGTSAKLACLAAEGSLAEGEIYRQAGILGTLPNQP